jgi:hypothetical protein
MEYGRKAEKDVKSDSNVSGRDSQVRGFHVESDAPSDPAVNFYATLTTNARRRVS